MTSGRLLRSALALAFSGGFLWLLMRGVDGPRLLALLASASWVWLVAGLAALAGGYAGRIRRWQLLLRHENPALRWRQCAGPLLAGFAMNNVLPFRAGDVLRCVGFGGQLGVSGGGAAATLFSERLLDALTLLLALGLALAVFGIDGQRFFAVSGAAVAALTVTLLLFPRLLVPALRAAAWLAGRALPRLGERIGREVGRAVELLDATSRRQALVPLMGWSCFVWVAEGAMFYCVARSLPGLEAPTVAWLALPVATLATLLPGTPGHLGTFDYFAAEAMAAGGNSALAATAYALLVHLWVWWPVTAAGGLWLWLRRA